MTIDEIIEHALDESLEPRNRLQGVIARLRQLGSTPPEGGEPLVQRILRRIEIARDDFPAGSDKWLGVQRALMDARAEAGAARSPLETRKDKP